jgi:hypothetical protein
MATAVAGIMPGVNRNDLAVPIPAVAAVEKNRFYGANLLI